MHDPLRLNNGGWLEPYNADGLCYGNTAMLTDNDTN